jgi:hypothetical protein
MLSFAGSLRVFVAIDPCDMRKGFDGLHALVTERLQGRQWGQICPFDISTRSLSAGLRILCAAAASRTLQGPLLSYRSNRRLEIGSSSRRDTTAQTLRFATLLGPTTVCQMDRSDAMAPFQGSLADNWGVAGWRLPGMCRGAMFVPRRRVRGG